MHTNKGANSYKLKNWKKGIEKKEVTGPQFYLYIVDRLYTRNHYFCSKVKSCCWNWKGRGLVLLSRTINACRCLNIRRRYIYVRTYVWYKYAYPEK